MCVCYDVCVCVCVLCAASIDRREVKLKMRTGRVSPYPYTQCRWKIKEREREEEIQWYLTSVLLSLGSSLSLFASLSSRSSPSVVCEYCSSKIEIVCLPRCVCYAQRSAQKERKLAQSTSPHPDCERSNRFSHTHTRRRTHRRTHRCTHMCVQLLL